jgi:hypothetical protein
MRIKTMRTRTGALTLSALCLTLLAASVTAQAAPVTSPLVKQMYDGGWPSAKELNKTHEQFLLQRAMQSYMMTLPALNVIGLRDGSEAEFGAGYNVLWFGPKKPKGVDEKNFIQSIPGRAQMIAVRLYGTVPEFYDQTWKPDDVVKIK